MTASWAIRLAIAPDRNVVSRAAVVRTWRACPVSGDLPKLVIAIGDDACDGGIFKGSYAVLGGVDKVLPVDLKIPGDPPSPREILKGLLALMRKIDRRSR